jgi:hypothetical protein
VTCNNISQKKQHPGKVTVKVMNRRDELTVAVAASVDQLLAFLREVRMHAKADGADLTVEHIIYVLAGALGAENRADEPRGPAITLAAELAYRLL